MAGLDKNKYPQRLVDRFDEETLEAGLTKREAADLALTIASEFETRADGLNEEADGDEDDASGDKG